MEVFTTSRVPMYISRFVSAAVDYLQLRDLEGVLDVYSHHALGAGDEYGYCFGDRVLPLNIELHYANKVHGESLPREEKLLTIAHEMIHVKQIALGELLNEKVDGSEINRWRGPGFVVDADDDDLSYEEYVNLPWEKEAFERQEEVYLACKDIK